MEKRDLGSRAPYRNEKNYVEERLKERDFAKSFLPREQEREEPPAKKMKTEPEMGAACEDLFTVAYRWQYHSEFLKNVRKARLSVEEAKKNLMLAATVQIRSAKTISSIAKI